LYTLKGGGGRNTPRLEKVQAWEKTFRFWPSEWPERGVVVQVGGVRVG
jgi:hypothetical protein